MSRPLGKNQIGVLEAMGRFAPYTWHARCGWYWDTYGGTDRICQSLVARGLAGIHHPETVDGYGHYALTQEGIAKVKELRGEGA